MTRTQWIIIGVLGVAVVCIFAFLALGAVIVLNAPSKTQVVYVEITSTPSTQGQTTTVPVPNQATTAIPTPVPTTRLLPSPTAKVDPEIAVRAHECKVSKTDVFCVVTVANPSQNAMVSSVYFDFNVFDPNGISIGGFWEATNSLFPLETRKVFVHNSLKSGTTFGRYTMTARVSGWGAAGYNFAANPLTVSNIEFQPGSFIYDKVIVLVNNQSDKTIDGVHLDAILYDKSGGFVGGGDGFSPILPPKGKARAEINVEKVGQVSKVEVYPSLSIISKVE